MTPQSRAPPADTFKVEAVTTKARKLPNRVVLHALEGWGKTSFAAQAPSPVFLPLNRWRLSYVLWRSRTTEAVPSGEASSTTRTWQSCSIRAN